MKLSQKPDEKYRLILKGVDIDIDLEHFETQDCLKAQGITKILRLKNYLKQESTTVLAHIDTEANFKKLLKGHIFINQLRFKPEQFVQILRCFNCNRLGHTTHKCKSDATCAKCSSTKHETIKCRAKHLKCINCEGEHASSIRKCPKIAEIQEHSRSSINSEPKAHRATTKAYQSYATAVSNELGNFKFGVLQDEIVA